MAKSAALLLTWAIIAPASVLAQHGPDSPFLDPSKPGVYLTFVRVGKIEPLFVGDSGQGVFFRLHNNVRWDVLLNMNGVPPRNGDAYLFYEVSEDPQGYPPTRIPIGTPGPHVCSVNSLGPGESILFSVPKEHIGEGLAFRIRFNYGWEAKERPGIPYGNEPEHTVAFYHSALPERLRRGERRRPLMGETLVGPGATPVPLELPEPPAVMPADPLQPR